MTTDTPPEMPAQMAFDLPVRPARDRAAFFVSPANALAVAQIDAWRDWPSRKLALIGPEGAGKTHLAHVWSGMSGAAIVDAAALAGLPLRDLVAGGAVAVEDAERAAGDNAAETALFHLHNLAQQEGAALLLTARQPPRAWPLTLPDLASRMQATATIHLDPPDDALLSAVLVKLFADRQLAVPPALISYLVEHMERSFGAAAGIVAAIDREALATRRKPGLGLARDVLDKTGMQGR
jgi:chromosomal replication initiation ATPase DnaA